MPGFAIDTGSDYSSGGEVGATTPDVEEEYDDGGSSSGGSSGGSVSTGGGTVVPESGVTPEENTGTIDLGETGDVEDTLYDDPQPAHESDLFNPDGGPSAGARIPDADTFPESPSSNDGILNRDFWNVVINEDGEVIDSESGGAGDILDDLEGPAPLDEGYTPVPEPDYSGDGTPGGQLTDRLPIGEPDWDGDGSPGGNLTDREPDWDGDGSPGGNLDERIPDIPNVPVPDPQAVVNGLTATVVGAVIVAYFIGTRGAGS